MKTSSRLTVLVVLLLCALALCPSFATATELNADLSDVEEALNVNTVQAEIVYQQLMSCHTMQSIFDTMMLEENRTGMYALNAEQLNGIHQLTQSLYASLESPTEDETYYFNDIVDTLTAIADNSSVTLLATVNTITSNSTWSGSILANGDFEYIMRNGATIQLRDIGISDNYQTGTITIKSGATLTISGYGGFARADGNTRPLFIIENGGKLILKGNSAAQPVIMDGRSVIASAPLIDASGALDFQNAVIQNAKNRSVSGTGSPNGLGGGISISSTGSLLMDSCVVTRNTASLNGGGLHAAGSVTISNSTISYNRAASAETGGVNAGRGGGFNLAGANAVGTMTNVTVTQNAAMYYGGGGQLISRASLTMNEGTVFSYNEAILHGAGALHVTADSTFTMNGGSMENNKAQSVGGAIHSSYACVLNLNAGRIVNNTANGRGGGIHINTGGAITLGGGLVISGNRVYNQPTGTASDMDATGDTWSNVVKNGPRNDNGYGGGVLIDSGTCTVAGATITGNYAEVGGGGVALVMLNPASSGHYDDLMVADFTMTSGLISDNTTSGDGAGAYLMSNKLWELDTGNNISEDIKNGLPEARVSGGTIQNNNADENGGGLYLAENTKFFMSGTALFDQNDAVNGGAVYIAKGTADISGGAMQNNTADTHGGGLYVAGNVTISAGEFKMNDAINGGAVYVTDGDLTMSNGTINSNTAVSNGGAIYMNGGNFTMEHGEINSNKAVQGGAVYMAGETSIFKMESGTMNSNQATDDGGAIYATGGTLYIGLESCKTENDAALAACTHHTAKGEGRHHPIIEMNTAADTGGGIAISKSANGVSAGVVHFYCGQATRNEALYKGVGMNVFMQGGEFHLYDGANVGKPRDPDLVIIGGELHNECETKEYVTLLYYKNNTEASTDEGFVFEGLAELNEMMNMPEGEYFWQADAGYRFFGWTAKGYDSTSKSVRNKNEYVQSGDPVEIIDEATDSEGNPQIVFDNDADMTMHLYALWAPIENHITYVNGMTHQAVAAHQPYTYTIHERDYVIQDIQPITQDGYRVAGWYIYQDLGKNANWSDGAVEYEPFFSTQAQPPRTDYEHLLLESFGPHQYLPVSDDGNLDLTVPELTFGDITLVAHFVPAYTDLQITKSGITDAWQELDAPSFLFSIHGVPEDPKLAQVDMQIVIYGNGSTLLKYLPVGDYTVTELESWSWRYTADDAQQHVTLNDPKVTRELVFTNTRIENELLDGETGAKNVFD